MVFVAPLVIGSFVSIVPCCVSVRFTVSVRSPVFSTVIFQYTVFPTIIVVESEKVELSDDTCFVTSMSISFPE